MYSIRTHAIPRGGTPISTAPAGSLDFCEHAFLERAHLGQERNLEHLKGWGCKFALRDLGDAKLRAAVIGVSAAEVPDVKAIVLDQDLTKARNKAQSVYDKGIWPRFFFLKKGVGRPRRKKYLSELQAGHVPTTFWAGEELEAPVDVDSTSWPHKVSGHSQQGVDELTAIVGPGHEFKTVKPLKLFRKIIQIWCPQNGIVFDPFAGSGTTAHAVMEVNAATDGSRRFILVEQGRPERGDAYARSLTAVRVRRAITGERVPENSRAVAKTAQPLPGGFRFCKLTSKVDAGAVLALEREEMLDLLLTTHWDQGERAAAHLRRLPAGQHAYLFAISSRGEGFFLVWNGPDKPAVLDRAAFRGIVEEAKAEKLAAPLHVYARTAIYQSPNVEFYQIPDRILEKLGFNETVQPYTGNVGEESTA